MNIGSRPNYWLITLSFLVLLQIKVFHVNAQQVANKFDLKRTQSLNYLLYIPPNYSNSTELFPLVLFLHGGGESGSDIELVKKHGFPKLIEQGKQYPFFVLAPQNPVKKKFWNEKDVLQLLDSVISSHRVDEKRIYLTGMSRGGYGAWSLAAQYPDRFAALVAVCGVAPSPYASWLGQMPIWVFHGVNDNVIPVSESVEMVKELRRNGNNAKLTLYPEVGHNAWDYAYTDEEMVNWLVKQSKK